MKYSALSAILGLTALPFATAVGVSVTPHQQFSSSPGVLGCKINTDRVAYWPQAVDCTNFCKKLTSSTGLSTYVMHIDQSGGAYDISYDAWVYLQNGGTATTTPLVGGGVSVDVEQATPEECAHLMDDGKMPFTAYNGANFYTSCLASNSWIGKNYELFNIANMVCTYGKYEVCTLDPASQ